MKGNIELRSADLFLTGIAGYLVKDEIRDGITSAVTRAFSGQFVVTKSISKFEACLPKKIRKQIHIMPPGVQFEKLSKRLHQVAHLYAGGLSPSQIADELKLSLKTVRTYIKRIHEIVGASDKWQVFMRLTARLDEIES